MLILPNRILNSAVICIMWSSAAGDPMSTEKKELLFEDFNLWLKTKFTDVFWHKGHKFEKTKGEDVLIDGGVFSKEEAKQLFQMLNSRNPIIRLNATFIIWERNGLLIKLLIALASIVLLFIYIRVRR